MREQLDKLMALLRTLQAAMASGDYETDAGRHLHDTALLYLSKDASPRDEAPDALACAESVNAICYAAFGDYVGGELSTYRLYLTIINNKKFRKAQNPMPGDIIVSPTGFGIGNGHVGICGKNNVIMSNSSATGLWSENYDQVKWRNFYGRDRGFPVYYFRRITY